MSIRLTLAELFERPAPKRFRRGTHRVSAPEETLARVRPFARQMGITRLGNITGLDHIGIPVAVAVRPNSRSVSVSQGKGMELPQAMASALMEAAEGFHAEEVGPDHIAPYRYLAGSAAVVDPAELCTSDRPFDPAAPIGWTEGYDLLQREPCWVPADLVHTDYTRQQSDGFFRAGSNGLASGNHLVEAVNAALYELVERDAVALWINRPIQRRAQCALDLASVDDPDCRALLAKYAAAAMALRVWHVTSDIGLPAFLCEIRDLTPGEPGRLRRFHGSGCHADRAVALSRALTEAAQTRLTYIAGIRDDLSAAEYREPEGTELGDLLLDALVRDSGAIAFSDVPSFAAEDLTDDLRWALGRLAAAGCRRVVGIDLTRAEFAVSVVRLVISGLEGDPHHPNYMPGRRAGEQASA
jgi:ribosomal protein S12 methylthiotransferase accessory factor